MQHKRSFGAALPVGLAALALVLAGCAGGGDKAEQSTPTEEQPESEAAPAGDITVAFIPGISSDPFFRAMEIAAHEEADALGINLIWQGSAQEYSPQSQIPFVDAALAEDIQGLVLVPTDADALQPAVTKATELGIPVVTVDTTVADQSPLVSHITGDNLNGGMLAAETMQELTGGGKVLIISASPTNTTGTQRAQGFEDAAADLPDLQLLPTQYAYSQPTEATTILNTTLLEHPDLAGVFALDGQSCTGAIAALKNSDAVGTVKLVCYDAYSNQVAELEAGTISALIAQDPAQEARLALQYIYAVITGEGADQVEKTVVIPNVVITADNLEEMRGYQYAE